MRPLTTPASTSVQGPWQITPTGLPASKKERAKPTASSEVRSWSGLATPPGRTRASNSPASASPTAPTSKTSPLSRWLKACASPASGASSSASAPASRMACSGWSTRPARRPRWRRGRPHACRSAHRTSMLLSGWDRLCALPGCPRSVALKPPPAWRAPRSNRLTSAGTNSVRASIVSSSRPTAIAKASSRKERIGTIATIANEAARISPATVIARPARAPAVWIAGRRSRRSASRQILLTRKTL